MFSLVAKQEMLSVGLYIFIKGVSVIFKHFLHLDVFKMTVLSTWTFLITFFLEVD